LAIRGHFTITDNVSGGWGGTTSDAARYDTDQIEDSCGASLVTYDAPTNTQMEARTLVTADYATDTKQDTAQADLDKVPKSDGSVSFNTTALGDINTECDEAVVTALTRSS